MSRPTLASRTAQVTTAVAAATVIIGGLLAFVLSQGVAETGARRNLGRLADRAVLRYAQDHQPRAAMLLIGPGVSVGLVGPNGEIDSRTPQVVGALTVAEVRDMLAGGSVSAVRSVAGSTVLVEARPLPAGSGGVVLVQRRSDALDPAAPIFRRTAVAMLLGLAVAVPSGILLARRLALPLRRAADAAHALAAGQRDVRVPIEGPAEVAEVADSINRLSEALQFSEGRQRDFLLSVSHELRTPLTAIGGFAESLADGVTTGTDVPAAGQTILAESRRLERLVSDLLDLARLGAADFRIDLTDVDLTSLLADAAGVWRARCDAVGVRFTAELPPAPVWVRSDPTRVRQIIDGLAENALRVTPAGRPIVFALSVGPQPPAGVAVLQVRDGGPGLTPDDCAVAFTRSALYQRYRGVRQVGTGLGLALVHGLATRLGGTAQAGRAAEGGASFVVRLPLAGGFDRPTVPLYPRHGSVPPGR
ncbi:MAG: HAMP domain-containing histidine kinase [Actinobacteria bacterium]|nr:HAMP domain-containing histidine kinase [Actinomycetota bacterium]